MKDTIPWTEWVKDRNVEPRVREVRKRVLDDLCEANGKDSVDDLLNDIYLDKVTPYVASRKYVNELRDREIRPGKKLRPGTIGQWRSMLPEFWLSVLGKPNFDVETFDRIAPFKNTGTEIIKKAPTREELIHLLNIANPRDRALLAILCSGMRIGEALSRKMGDIQKGKNGKDYSRLVLKPGETKMKYRRWVPLTAETVNWIRAYHESVKSDWIFPSDFDDNHLRYVPAWKALKRLFANGGLVDEDEKDEVYSPHSMRKFAENYMLRCGLPDKFVGAIIGHAGPLGRAYKDEEDNETTEKWFEVCNDRMTWLQPVEVIKHDLAQDKKVQDLEAKLNLLLSAVAAKLTPHEGHSPTEQLAALQKLLEDKKGDKSR